MATFFTLEAADWETGAATDLLEEIYRASFAERMRQHFREMVSGAYSAYVLALDEGFDAPLRGQLGDVLQNLLSREAVLAGVFESELLRRYQAATASGASGPAHLPAAAGKEELRACLQKIVRAAETCHGSAVQAAAGAYANLLGRPLDGFRSAWSAAVLLAAFGVVLEAVARPLHPRVELALYKMFAQEVLKHLGDACLAFRDALPDQLVEVGPVPDPSVPVFWTAGPTVGASPSAVRPALSAAAGGAAALEPALRLPAWLHALEPAAERPAARVSRAPARGERSRWLPGVVAALALAAIGTAGWQVRENFRDHSGVFTGGFENAAAAANGLRLLAAGSASSIAAFADHAAQATLRHVQLRSYGWSVRPGGSEMLFDLTVANAGPTPVASIEIVCLQQDADTAVIDSARTILGGPIGAGETRDFQAIPMGHAKPAIDRATCAITDLDAAPPS